MYMIDETTNTWQWKVPFWWSCHKAWTLTIKSRRWLVEYHIPLLRWKWKTVSGVKCWSTPYILQAIHQQSVYKSNSSVSNTDAEVRLSHTCKRCERWEMLETLQSHRSPHEINPENLNWHLCNVEILWVLPSRSIKSSKTEHNLATPYTDDLICLLVMLSHNSVLGKQIIDGQWQ
jgi:hypothetical protein